MSRRSRSLFGCLFRGVLKGFFRPPKRRTYVKKRRRIRKDI